ncbi:MAG: hypothetical protein ACHQFX_04800 [Chitinophagales bacterium]
MALYCTIFSQTTSKKKAFSEHGMNVRKAANYYLKKKINPSPQFSVQYASLFSGLQGYRKKDTLLAAKLIKRLYKVNDILFYRLMRIRLEWEFRQHVQLSPLDSILPRLKNNIDSSKYYYMMGLYFEDSMYVRTARRFGYVRVNSDGNEIVDWRKMRSFKFDDPRLFELHNDIDIDISSNHNYSKRDPIADTAILYYKKAINLDTSEFYYLKNLLILLSFVGDDAETQQVISSNLGNYTDKEKKWLKKYLDSH